MSEPYQYPATPHLPWSETIGVNGVVAGDPSCLIGKEVVVTEKMDGENTTMYSDKLHGKFIDSPYHPSRTWAHGLHSTLRFKINDSQRICGENVFWVKSIIYTALPSYFLVLTIWENDICFSWDDTVGICNKLDMDTPPVLYRGEYNEELISSLYNESQRDIMEGYVVRATESFSTDNFDKNVFQFKREAGDGSDLDWIRTGGELNMLKVKKR